MVQSYHTTHKKSKRQVTDITSWLEAWNHYLVCRLAHTPSMAVELAKYQAVVFARYPPAACIEYDRLFRQAAARDRSLRWDVPKEDVSVWALTQPSSVGIIVNIPFVTAPERQSQHDWDPHLTPYTCQASGHKRFNLAKCTKGDDCMFAHACWHRGCLGNHPGKGCPKQS